MWLNLWRLPLLPIVVALKVESVVRSVRWRRGLELLVL